MFYRLRDDLFHETAEEFEANHEYDLAKKHYAKLEQQGLVVSRDTLQRSMNMTTCCLYLILTFAFRLEEKLKLTMAASFVVIAVGTYVLVKCK
jgi:hypothetical protein